MVSRVCEVDECCGGATDTPLDMCCLFVHARHRRSGVRPPHHEGNCITKVQASSWHTLAFARTYIKHSCGVAGGMLITGLARHVHDQ